MTLRRRDFITLIGGAAASSVWPAAARAQQGEGMRRIGWLAGPAKGTAPIAGQLNAFKRAIADLGWIEGRNVAFEERWAANDPERLHPLAAELVVTRPDLIFVVTSLMLTIIRRATGTIPIVFSNVTDPVGQGFVSSLAEPGGNITGFASDEFELSTKQLDLLKQVAPGLTRVAFISDRISLRKPAFLPRSRLQLLLWGWRCRRSWCTTRRRSSVPSRRSRRNPIAGCSCWPARRRSKTGN
jgi:putative ABC transport system substrate-binding protein